MSLRWPRGLVIGKFFPPHLGHSHLIRTGRSLVHHLDVMVCVRADDPIPGELRLAWLREMHPDCEIRHVPDDLPADDTALWVRETLRTLPRAPDVVFSSEDYGPPYAAGLGAAHVMVDRERIAFPVSGTLVRAAPHRALRWLGPPVRAHFAPRIVILGAESTGTTTLARALAERLGTEWVPEYGRDYSVAKLAAGEAEWRTEEFVHIAQTQNRWEDGAARRATGPVVLDTDAFATGVWHERYVGHRSPEVEALARPAALTVLTGDEIPFVQDGLRDGEHLRRWMTDVFRERLRGRDHIEVGGPVPERVRKVLAAMEERGLL